MSMVSRLFILFMVCECVCMLTVGVLVSSGVLARQPINLKHGSQFSRLSLRPSAPRVFPCIFLGLRLIIGSSAPRSSVSIANSHNRALCKMGIII